jgi:RNA polymerase sigma factor (sigma-70 family)
MLKQVEDLKFYLFRALKNRLLNIQKSTAKYVTTDISEFKLSVKTDSLNLFIEEEEQIMIKEKINKLLEVLSNKQREIIYLRFFHEMTYEEIGELTEMTPASVKNVVYKAIKKIRK